MLPRARRLSRQNFVSLKHTGHTYKYPHFSFVSSPSPLPFSRFAVVTPLSISKSAVVRNNLRRNIYDSLANLSSTTSIDCIIYPKASVLNLSHEELVSALHSAVSSFTSS